MNQQEKIYKRIITAMGILLAVAIIVCLASIKLNVKIMGISITMIIMCVLVIIICAILLSKEQKKKLNLSDNPIEQEIKNINQLYNSNLKYPELNKAKWVKQNIEFRVGGKFYIEKNFNNKKGYHLAFEIIADEITFMPKDYDNVVGYDRFLVNIGYFEGEPLSLPENEEGIIVQNLNLLKGKTFYLNDKSKFVFTIDTVETDDIDYGMIRIIDFNENSMTLSFRFANAFGINDVTIGTVKLEKDQNIKSAILKDLIRAKTPLTIKDIVGDSGQPNIMVDEYIENTTNCDFNKIISLTPVLRNAYIADLFLDRIYDGGLVYAYDTSGMFKDYLLEAFNNLGNKELTDIISQANEIINAAEQRIGSGITDNIESLSDEEDKKLNELNDRIDKMNMNNELFDLVCDYINKHLNDKL